MDQRLILYKLQKYQNKLESGNGDKSIYDAKIEYYQKYLLEGGLWGRKKTKVAPITTPSNDLSNFSRSKAIKEKPPRRPEDVDYKHECLQSLKNIMPNMFWDPLLQKFFKDIQLILNRKFILNKRKRVTELLFQIGHEISKRNLNEPLKSNSLKKLVELEQCFKEKKLLIDANLYHELNYGKEFLKIMEDYSSEKTIYTVPVFNQESVRNISQKRLPETDTDYVEVVHTPRGPLPPPPSGNVSSRGPLPPPPPGNVSPPPGNVVYMDDDNNDKKYREKILQAKNNPTYASVILPHLRQPKPPPQLPPNPPPQLPKRLSDLGIKIQSNNDRK
jgi:hypothetical protein